MTRPRVSSPTRAPRPLPGVATRRLRVRSVACPLGCAPTPAKVQRIGAPCAFLPSIFLANRGCPKRLLSRRADPRIVPFAGRYYRLGWIKTVTHVTNSPNQLVVFRTQFGAQAAHMHVHGAGAAVIIKTPHVPEQLVAGEDPTQMLHEVLQQFEFLVGEIQRHSA